VPFSSSKVTLEVWRGQDYHLKFQKIYKQRRV